MDQQAGFVLARAHRLLDSIEGHGARDDAGAHSRSASAPSSTPRRRHRDLPRRDPLAGDGRARHDDRTVAVAEGGAVGQQEVALGQARVGVEGDGRDGELSRHRAPVERFDVGQLVDEGETLGIDASFGERVEHERVVGVGAVRDGDGLVGSHRAILLRRDAGDPDARNRAPRLDLRPGGRHNELNANARKFLEPDRKKLLE